MPKFASAEYNVLCLIYSDTGWDIGSVERIRRLIAEFRKAQKVGNVSLAWKHLYDTKPECVRAKPGETISQKVVNTSFDSYRGKYIERRFREFFFNQLDVTFIKHIAVYKAPDDQLHGYHGHCDLTLVIWD